GRLPGGGHRPELLRPGRLLHRADGRQLRRRRAAVGVAAAARRGRGHARGAMRAALAAGALEPEDVLCALRAQPPMAGAALASRVSTREPYAVCEGDVRIAVVDYGVKRSVL